ncbi:MAG: hypothetical protein Q9162_005650 [Coniocarpon cinnabarinum]
MSIHQYWPPNLKTYRYTKEPATALIWNANAPSKMSGSFCRARDFSQFCQRLHSSMRYDTSAAATNFTRIKRREDSMVASYLLACCMSYEGVLGFPPSAFEIARTLLLAGADPMIECFARSSTPICESPWRKFIKYIRFVHACMSERDDLPYGFDRLTPTVIIDLTKAFILNGADVDHEIRIFSTAHLCLLKRRNLCNETYDMVICATAGYILEEFLPMVEGAGEVLEVLSQLMRRPTRHIEQIIWHSGSIQSIQVSAGHNVQVCPDPFASSCHIDPEEECILWPLVEAWEDSGSSQDLDALQQALRDVAAAHDHVPLEEFGSTIATYSESTGDEGHSLIDEDELTQSADEAAARTDDEYSIKLDEEISEYTWDGNPAKTNADVDSATGQT